jgi:hypothetical protein
LVDESSRNFRVHGICQSKFYIEATTIRSVTFCFEAIRLAARLSSPSAGADETLETGSCSSPVATVIENALHSRICLTGQGSFAAARCRLKHQPPQETMANLRLLQSKTKREEQAALFDSACHYLQSRLPMLDYARCRRRGCPVGSGSVESWHKVVVQRRLNGAGIRWAEQHLDPMLALRDLVYNGCWEEGWQQIVLFQQEQQLAQKVPAADARQPPPQPLTFPRLQAAGLVPEDEPPDASPATSPKKPWPPGPDPPGATTNSSPRILRWNCLVELK